MAVEQAIEAWALEFGFEFCEAALELPLGRGFLVIAEELAACGRWIGATESLAFAWPDRCASERDWP